MTQINHCITTAVNSDINKNILITSKIIASIWEITKSGTVLRIDIGMIQEQMNE